ncbi:hypothetical protein [Kitasatospora sp. NPDC058046]|uniref:hypothetical protein n=1 Tax=Kitasatospora sp. NPDC058046 TaxID=3346312 RepID=UPI0036DEB3AC
MRPLGLQARASVGVATQLQPSVYDLYDAYDGAIAAQEFYWRDVDVEVPVQADQEVGGYQ